MTGIHEQAVTIRIKAVQLSCPPVKLTISLEVTKIQTDPDPHNLRAIRCYEKAGFKAVRTIITPHGLALYMGSRAQSEGIER